MKSMQSSQNPKKVKLPQRKLTSGASSEHSDGGCDHPANDENPTHREDFNSLVNVAVRKREPKG